MYGHLSRYTTLGVGGRAKELVIARSEQELIDNGDALVLGCGSNVLVSDRGYDGTVVINRFEEISVCGDTVTAGSGTRLGVLCNVLCESELGGLEWASGIPGSIGGAVRMNAGAFGGQISDVLLFADVLRDGELIRLGVSELGLGYRTSALKSGDVIISATLRLQKRDKKNIADLAAEYRAKRLETQPKGRSAGSVFKNRGGVPVAKALDNLGFKGYRIGGAMVSNEHANIIVNTGDATADDVYSLIKTLKSALEDIGYDAQEEIIYIGDF